MALVETILFVVQILVAVTLCGLILLQHGKGADMGAAFGSGSSGSLFGAAGSANFLSRTTAILAAVFFLTSLGLTYLGMSHTKAGTRAGRDAGRSGDQGRRRRAAGDDAGTCRSRTCDACARAGIEGRGRTEIAGARRFGDAFVAAVANACVLIPELPTW